MDDKLKDIEEKFYEWINDPIDGAKFEYTQEQKKEILAFIKSQI